MTIDEIIDKAGGLSRLAEALGVDHSSICYWRRVQRVPVARAIDIHDRLGIPLHEIRPDVWRQQEAAG